MYREKIRKIFQPVIKAFAFLEPDFITFLGFVIVLFASFIIYRSYFRLGGIILIIGSIFDMIDGGVARMKGKVTKFGAFIDSTLDRYSEFFIIISIILSKFGRDFLIPGIFTLLGSFMTSYTRARGEGIGIEIKEGILQRGERVVIITLGLLINKNVLYWFLVLLAILTNITAIQRIFIIWKSLKREV